MLMYEFFGVFDPVTKIKQNTHTLAHAHLTHTQPIRMDATPPYPLAISYWLMIMESSQNARALIRTYTPIFIFVNHVSVSYHFLFLHLLFFSLLIVLFIILLIESYEFIIKQRKKFNELFLQNERFFGDFFFKKFLQANLELELTSRTWNLSCRVEPGTRVVESNFKV